MTRSRRVYRLLRMSQKAVLNLLVVLLAVFAVFPLFWLVTSSLKLSAELYKFPVTFIPQTVSWKFYETVLTLTYFPRYFTNSLLVALGTTVATTAMAAMGAYSIVRYHHWFSNLLARAILFAYLFPKILLVIPFFILLLQIGLVNTRTGLTISHVVFTLPFALWFLVGYFKTIPREIEEAARIDGAANITIFLRIVLPLSRPGLVAAAIFTFISSWNEFLFALVLTTAKDVQTISVGLYGLVGGETMEWGQMLASSTLVILPVLIFFLLIQRNLAEGMTGGALR